MMAIPGGNILKMAQRVIASQTVAYHQFLCREPNEVGQQVAKYAQAVTLKGSFQAVPRTLYQTLGLEFNKNYINFYVSKALIDIERNVSGDQLSFMGKKYQVESATDWMGMDGWVAVLCVQISQEEGCEC